MAFTEAQLLADIAADSATQRCKIIGFIVGATHTDVYLQNDDDTKNKTGPWVQIPNTYTAAQAHTAIDNVMSGAA